jgi:hypothetical protein
MKNLASKLNWFIPPGPIYRLAADILFPPAEGRECGEDEKYPEKCGDGEQDKPKFGFTPGCSCRNCAKYPEFHTRENYALIREKAQQARRKRQGR